MTKASVKELLEQGHTFERHLNATLRTLSNLRLVLAIGVVCGLVAYVRLEQNIGLFLGIACAVVFMVQVRRFQNVRLYLQDHARKQAVLERYKLRLEDAWQGFEDTGSTLPEAENVLAQDLDLFGKGSLYQYLSVAHTARGRSSLAKLLTNPGLQHIAERQEAVRELLANDDDAIRFEAMAYREKEAERKRDIAAEQFMRQYATEAEDPRLQLYIGISLAWPLFTLFAALAAILGWVPIWLPFFCVMSQIAGTILFGHTIQEQKEKTIAFVERLRGMNGRIMQLLNADYKSAYLSLMQEELKDAVPGLGTLRLLVGAWRWRENFILYWILCGVFAWDFQCLVALAMWKRRYGSAFPRWLDWIGEVEALYSLGTLARVREDETVFPTVLESDEPILILQDGKHPLLPPDKVVANSFHQEGEVAIITGSNMSGKSTFMRMLGLSAILAYAGGAVCATSLCLSPMRVMTSMRVRDDVQSGISTFYGEILRIKAMSNYAETHRATLILIDEIFKGTNTADRLIGAKAAIHKLAQPWLNTIVTTHDFELCDLVDTLPVPAKNYHFEEYYLDDEIHFDYTIRQGRCKTTNAKHLMRLAGLLEREEA